LGSRSWQVVLGELALQSQSCKIDLAKIDLAKIDLGLALRRVILQNLSWKTCLERLALRACLERLALRACLERFALKDWLLKDWLLQNLPYENITTLTKTSRRKNLPEIFWKIHLFRE
jgi:hypothetical protein